MALLGGLGILIHSPLQISGWHQWNAGNFMSRSRSQRPVSGLIVGGTRELDRLVECAPINDGEEHAVRPGSSVGPPGVWADGMQPFPLSVLRCA